MLDLDRQTLEATEGGNAEPGRCNGVQLRWGDFVLCFGDATFS